MLTYLAIPESDVSVCLTESGCIGIESYSHEYGKTVMLLLSPRQAQLMLEDLPDVISMARQKQEQYLEGQKEATNA